MLLLLVRHAQAGERDPSRWPDDRERPITDEGREIQAEVSKALRRARLRPDAVLTSPWTRARQTADVLVAAMKLDGEPVPCAALAADPDLAALATCVGERDADATVALVGHEPWIGELAALLLGGTTDAVTVDFPKSGVLGLDVDTIAPGGAALRFFWRPKQIERLA
ncbi:MAG TPA: histidine phosphatase family protein [Gemmatimonadales bacterium]|nr:histidine phosphatase family protein [Gemmatimonadales bacterium]